MSWANHKEVLKHFHMITKWEAFVRQTVVSIAFTALLVCFCYLFQAVNHFLLFLFMALYVFSFIDILLPNSRIIAQFGQRKTRKTDEKVITNDVPDKEDPGDNKKHGAGKKEDSEDRPYYSDHPDDQFTLTARIFQSHTLLLIVKIIFSFVAAASILKIDIERFQQHYLLGLSAVLFLGGVMMLLQSFLHFIESLEIEEFPEEIRKRVLLQIYKKLSYSRGYFFIGEVDGKKIGLPRMMRFLHTLIGGPTGEGKSSALIIPPLLFDADSPGSAVVPDAKSPELYNWVAGRWLKAGKKVYLFDPWHPETIAINPLIDADDQDLLTICDVMMREKEEAIGKEDAFFKSRTRYLLYAILKLAQSFKPQYCNLASVFKITESVKTLEKFIDSADDYMKQLFDDFYKLNSETKVNALTSIREKLDVFMDEPVRKAFSRREFSLSMLFREKEPCLIVLGCPIDKKEPGTKIASLIVNLIINMAFKERRLMKLALQQGKKVIVPNDLYLYLDELRNLKVTGLPDLVSIARETRSQVIASVTDLGFFKYYRDDYSSLMANFRNRIYMRGMDFDSAKYISDSLGMERKASYRLFKGVMVSQENLNLLDPDKVSNLPEDKIIVFTSQTNPFIANKVSIYKKKWLKKMRVDPPKVIRKLYYEWGNATEDLIDPVLPTLKDREYDMNKIKGAHKVQIDATMTPGKFFREERGGGVYRAASSSSISEVKGSREGRTEEDIAAVMPGPL